MTLNSALVFSCCLYVFHEGRSCSWKQISFLCLFHWQSLMLDTWTVFGIFVDFPFNALPWVGINLPSCPPGHILFLVGSKMKSQDVTPAEIWAMFSHSEVLFWSKNDLDSRLPYSLLVPFPVWLSKELLPKYYTHSTCHCPYLNLLSNPIWAYRPVLPTYSTYKFNRTLRTCLCTKGEVFSLSSRVALTGLSRLERKRGCERGRRCLRLSGGWGNS